MKRKYLKGKDNYVFILFFFITIIFLFSKNFIAFFRIIKEYIVGDVIITYEDFPNIGEWLQITTSVLFSYLLWKATIKSNELNRNTLKLQQYIFKKEEAGKLANIIFELNELYSSVRTVEELSNNNQLVPTLHEKFLLFKNGKYDIDSKAMTYLYAMYNIDSNNIIKNVEVINMLIGMVLDVEENKDRYDDVIYKDLFDSRVEALIRINPELEVALHNLLKELNCILENHINEERINFI